MMSELYQSFGLPSIHTLTLARNETYHIPRLYHRSSEGSEPESPSGGGSFNAQTEQPIQGEQRQAQKSMQSQESSFLDHDAPYIPPRPFTQSPRDDDAPYIPPRPFTQSPRDAVDYFTLDQQLYPQRSNYNSARYPYDQSSSPDLRGIEPRNFSSRQGYLGSGEPSRSGSEHTQWRHAHGQIRTHPPIYPGDDITFYDDQTASSSQSAHRSSTLPPLPPQTGVFDAQQDVLPMSYHHGGPESRFPDAGDYLRTQLNIGPGEPVNLWSLPDPPLGQKPPQPLPVLIKLAIYGSPRKKLTLQEIYTALENRFEWFKEHRAENAWKNSIRHNLSLNKVFRNTARPITEPGKGSYWELDVSEGEGYKRERKRRKKAANSTQSNVDDDDGSDENDEGSRSPPAAQTDANLDPQLRNEGHKVGGGRVRSNSRRTSPYLSSSPPVSSRQSTLDSTAFHSNSGSSSPGSATSIQSGVAPLPGSFTMSQPRFGQTSFGQPAFGQPSLGQPSYGQSSFGQRQAFGPSGFPPQPTAQTSQAAPPVFGQSSMPQGLYPPASSMVSSPGIFWPGQEQYTPFVPGTSMLSSSSSTMHAASNHGQGHRLDRSKSSMFLGQGSSSQGRGKGV